MGRGARGSQSSPERGGEARSWWRGRVRLEESLEGLAGVESDPTTTLWVVPLPVPGRNSSFARTYFTFSALRLNTHRHGCRRLRGGEGADEAGGGKDDGAERCGDGVAKAGGVVAVHFKSPDESGYATTV
jgi:hypothetical protein